MTHEKPLILVVDDEAHITHVVSLKLRNAGYEVITAGDGEEAFELATERAPALIITDLQMPYMTGIELCQKLATRKPTASIPVIVLTARGYGLTEDDMKDTSIVGVLSKPFSPREVLEHVESALQDAATGKSSPDAQAA